MVTNAYRQVHLLHEADHCFDARAGNVTNAYRQVHLLYVDDIYDIMLDYMSQMPIGKYIYCTPG